MSDFDSPFTFDDFATESIDFDIRKRKKFDMIFKVGFGGSISAWPLIYNEKIYFPSADHNLYCLDAVTGKEFWRFKAGDVFWGSGPQVYRGFIFIGNYDCYVYCIDAETGKEIWRFKTGGKIASNASIDNGVIYIGSMDGFLYAINMNGKEIWRFNTGDFIASQPTIYENKIFIGSFNGFLFCLEKKLVRKYGDSKQAVRFITVHLF